MSTFFEIAGEVIELELDATERVYGRPSPTGLSSLLAMEPETIEPRFKHNAVAAGGNELQQFSATQMIGRGMAGAGASILLVPDPIPFVDEVIGAGMIVVGSAMFYLG